MDHPIDDRQPVWEGIRENRFHFLQIELRLGHTLLDAASATQRDDIRRRRTALAQEAFDEVTRHLGHGASLALTEGERAELTTGLEALGKRLRAQPAAS